MRRLLSISMVLFLGLSPLIGTLEASDDTRLPACCRRHGEHHCAMTAPMAAMLAEAESRATPILTAPMSCPLFPGFMAGPSIQSDALGALAAGLPVPVAEAYTPFAGPKDVSLNPVRTHAGRGPPPASTLS